MLVLHDPDCLLHETIELLWGDKAIPALESPARLQAIVDALEPSHHTVRTINYTSLSDSEKQSLFTNISDTHDGGYLDHLENVFSQWRKEGLVQPDGSILPECFRFPMSIKGYNVNPQPPKDVYARTGFYAFDMSSGISSNTWTSTIASANLAYQAVHILFPPSSSTTEQPPNSILALCRPPGHHCDGHRAGGYCYINNVAVAISAFQSLHHDSANKDSKSKVAILDLDYHHGNGTQELYYATPDVLYLSIHGQDEFPYYTGHASETGIDAGEGYNLNLPLAKNSSLEAYLEKLDVAMERLAEYEGAGLLVVSLGFDTFELDPLGGFGIDREGYGVIAGRVRGRLREREMKTVVVLEGGYVIERLGENILSWLKGWEEG